MSARSIAAWERLGSEAECEDRMAAARGEQMISIALLDDLESVLAAHCDTDLHDPEILGVSAADIAEETPDFRAAYTAALDALVRGYREGGWMMANRQEGSADYSRGEAMERAIARSIDQVVVTRHPALFALLLERGLVSDDVEVIAHATPDDVRGRHVIGVLPLTLASLAASVTEIPLELSPAMRGVELDLTTLRRVAGPARTYVVRVVEAQS